jgi:hypothetical protein
MSLAIPRIKADGSVRIRAKLHEVKGRRGPTWFYSYNLRRRRVRSHRFKDRELALFEMRKTEDEYEAKTPFQVTTLSRQELDDAQGAFLTLHDNKVEKTLGEIVSWYVAKGPRCVPTSMAEAVDMFLATLSPGTMRPSPGNMNPSQGGLSPRTIKGYRGMLKLLKEDFGERQLSDLTTDDFRKYLNKASWGSISRWHHRQAASMLYLWAMKERPPRASENPLEPLPRMTKQGLMAVLPPPAVVTPAEARVWLSAAAETPHLPFVVLSFFAGMRRQEIQDFARLPEGGWTQINFATGRIHIPFKVGKTNQRYIEMHPTLVAWLKWLKRHKRTLFVAPNVNKGLRAIKRRVFPPTGDAAAVQPVNRANIARHSYISYSLRLRGASFAQVAMNAGNSEEVIKDHYNSLEVTPKQAAEFWSLTPKTLRISGNC